MRFVSRVFVFGLILTSACASARSPASPEAQPEASLKAAPKSAARVYTYVSPGEGFDTKTFFYDNGEEVVAFDTQFTPDFARAAIAYLRTQTTHPLTFAVVTHPNPDKFNGAAIFREAGAKVIASKATADAMPAVHDYKKYYFTKVAGTFTDATYPVLTSVDETFVGTYSLRLGNGDTIALRELKNPGVSLTQTIAVLPHQAGVMVGDLIHSRAHAWLEGGIVNGVATPTIAGWIADLREIQSLLKKSPQTPAYGGRGVVLDVATATKAQIQYLERADQIVTNYVRRLGKNRGELKDPKLSGTHFARLRQEFIRAFPQFSLDYLIEYGVYGLAQSKI